MEQTKWGRPTVASVDLEAIRENVRNTARIAGPDTGVIAVVKADGYGHGAVRVAEAALDAGAMMLAVATPEEAVELREAGLEADILLLGASPVPFARVASEMGIIITADSPTWMEQVAGEAPDFGRPLQVHLKVDTGMGRLGVRSGEDLLRMYRTARAAKIVVDGVFTHFATADEPDNEVWRKQASGFREAVALLPERPRLVHASNSAAAFMHPDCRFDAVRLGISLYGIAPSGFVGEHLPFPLRPALTLSTELVHVKRIGRGDTVSYGATYRAASDEWIGTLPIGYADGFLRGLGGQDVLIGGRRCPVVGRICMDQCMVRLPREMAPGEPVILLGKQGDEEIRPDEWADRLGTIPYEVVVTLSKRIPRVYLQGCGEY
ncbi:alanine racemase [Bhargavaea beijingensis]|uniref:Alanine racemase n=1 Tax=Bhargavaea beijingensis TaxID=426756 RepID=A0ABX9ZDB3_9BACL|nr:alanine racemase [Bhargavaea beijingensis]MCW1927664.1 alanine racemase [Bhargavaea beijingensis]RSK33327.1 alanine racemase [Bhargavaea beijingensis]